MSDNIKNKKRVIVVTWLGYGNYGTSLQSFALCKKLELLGCSVRYLSHFSKFCTDTPIDWIKNVYRYLRYHTFFHYLFSPKLRKLRRFHISGYQVCSALTKWGQKKILNDTDVFVSGSDQIWNVSHYYSPFMFLSFVKNSKRVSYASSIGTNTIPPQYQNIVKEHLKLFDSISVREKTAVSVLNELLENDKVVKVLDPTFLLDNVNWSNLTRDAQINYKLPSQYILCYFIGNKSNYSQQLQDIKDKVGIKCCIVIPSDENPNAFYGDAYYDREVGPKEFVYLINKADFICTDSFHATTISIIFSKQFVVFKRFVDTDNLSQNSRIYDLLGDFDLCNRIYPCDVNQRINYSEVQEKLSLERIRSEQYILKNICT